MVASIPYNDIIIYLILIFLESIDIEEMKMMIRSYLTFPALHLHQYLVLLLFSIPFFFFYTNASPTSTITQRQDQVQEPFGPLSVLIQFTRPGSGGQTSFDALDRRSDTTTTITAQSFYDRDDIAILQLEPTLDFEYADSDVINADPVPFSYFVDVNDYSISPVPMSMVKIVYGRADARCTVEAAAGGPGGEQAMWEVRAGQGPVELGGGNGVDVARIVCIAGEVEMYSEL